MKTPRIEKGIPIPKPKPGFKGKNRKYDWDAMDIDDSFMVWRPAAEITRTFNTLTSCRAHAQRKTGFKFEIRKVAGGLRVWRTK